MNEIKGMLSSKKAGEIRKAAKLLQKQLQPELETQTHEAWLHERSRKNSWENQVELIKAIGHNRFKSSLAILEEIADRNIEYDMITIVAATAVVRIKRKDLSDVTELKIRMKEMKYSLGLGLLDALGYDRMMPEQEDISIIIEHCWNFGGSREKGYVDPRYGLAAACAGWKGEKVKSFLNHCINTGDVPLIHVAENALKGKYIKLR